jgi:flagellar motility protein MotE (MotC chaperone)
MALKDDFMDGFNKFAKNLTEGANSVAKKSGEMVEVAKLNLAIQNDENRIEEIYKEIGKSQYKKSKEVNLSDEPESDEIAERFKEIDELFKSIETKKEKVLEIKSSVECPNCKQLVDKNTSYCPKCGTKL